MPGAGPPGLQAPAPGAYRPPGPMPPMPGAAGALAPARAPATPPVQTPAPGTARPGVIATLTPTARPGKKVARFIATDAARSTIAPSADGKLPELRLHETEEAKTAEKKGGSLSPFVLLVTLVVGVGMAIVLVLVDVAPEDTSAQSAKQRAREIIDAEYFVSVADKPLERYQIYLSEAQIAHSRRDFRAEREYYRRVLDMLRAERTQDRGLTGSRTRDRRLEEQISILLSNPS